MTKLDAQSAMNALFKAGLEIQQFLETLNWPFCFIGGLAVIRWGELRMTQDIDLCLLCGFGNEEKHAQVFLDNFQARIPDALTFALTNRVLLVSTSNRVAADISLSGLPFEEEMIKRSSPFDFYPDCSLITCSAEDLVVLKAFADRTKDWMDVESIILRQGRNLDMGYVLRQLSPLCDLKGAPEITARLKNMARKLKG
ncbi:MAG TPA: hypothetical protein VJ624_02585 [Thermodesulfobacteriota bacterium]|jgi:hypothetical protein|nr:hypothetical protein [Thermodesulfobacteriota bacterium]